MQSHSWDDYKERVTKKRHSFGTIPVVPLTLYSTKDWRRQEWEWKGKMQTLKWYIFFFNAWWNDIKFIKTNQLLLVWWYYSRSTFHPIQFSISTWCNFQQGAFSKDVTVNLVKTIVKLKSMSLSYRKIKLTAHITKEAIENWSLYKTVYNALKLLRP